MNWEVKLNWSKGEFKVRNQTKSNNRIESFNRFFFLCFVACFDICWVEKNTNKQTQIWNHFWVTKTNQTNLWVIERTNERFGWLVGWLVIWDLVVWLSEKEMKGELTIERIEKKSKSLTNHSTTKQASKQTNKWLVWMDWYWLKRKIEQWQKVDNWYFFVDCCC